jgi:hypothetical protein
VVRQSGAPASPDTRDMARHYQALPGSAEIPARMLYFRQVTDGDKLGHATPGVPIARLRLTGQEAVTLLCWVDLCWFDLCWFDLCWFDRGIWSQMATSTSSCHSLTTLSRLSSQKGSSGPEIENSVSRTAQASTPKWAKSS